MRAECLHPLFFANQQPFFNSSKYAFPAAGIHLLENSGKGFTISLMGRTAGLDEKKMIDRWHIS
jgi:hypothetical protein